MNANDIRCGRCAATGRFITMLLNGVPTGPGGICFRCGGKGYQTPEDVRRNDAYDRFAAGRAMHMDLQRPVVRAAQEETGPDGW